MLEVPSGLDPCGGSLLRAWCFCCRAPAEAPPASALLPGTRACECVCLLRPEFCLVSLDARATAANSRACRSFARMEGRSTTAAVSSTPCLQGDRDQMHV